MHTSVIDALSTDLSGVNTILAERHEPFRNGVLFTGSELFNHLTNHWDTIWVMTYTVHPSHAVKSKVGRLLYYAGCPDFCKNHRQLLNIHSKLYIGLAGGKPRAAWTGSQNFVKPTTENLMVAIPTAYVPRVVSYFNHFWEEAKR